MGLARLDPARWLLATEHYAAEIAEKRRLLAAGADIARCLPEAEPAVRETLDLIAAHLERHHPEPPPAPPETAPLHRAGLWVQEDLCWLSPGADGYRLVAAFLAFPARWRLADKIGRPLGAIHAPVPGFAERLLAPTERIFEGLEVERPLERANWSLVDDPALHQPQAKPERAAPVVTAESAGARLFVRVERQTLRRLPATGDVLFTIHTFVEPLAAVASEPATAAALRSSLRDMPEAMLAYKNLTTALPAVDAYLAAREAA
jgi:hypothetical protein